MSLSYFKQEGVYYDKTFSPDARLESIRLLLDFASHKVFELVKIDVKGTLSNGFIEEEKFCKTSLVF